MNLLNDIAEIVKDDKEHNVEVRIDAYGITVYLEYDPEIDNDTIIPIRYSTLEEFAYIPYEEYIEKFQPIDYGIDSSEIELIQRIMGYMENNKVEIKKICDQFGCLYRKSS